MCDVPMLVVSKYRIQTLETQSSAHVFTTTISTNLPSAKHKAQVEELKKQLSQSQESIFDLSASLSAVETEANYRVKQAETTANAKLSGMEKELALAKTEAQVASASLSSLKMQQLHQARKLRKTVGSGDGTGIVAAGTKVVTPPLNHHYYNRRNGNLGEVGGSHVNASSPCVGSNASNHKNVATVSTTVEQQHQGLSTSSAKMTRENTTNTNTKHTSNIHDHDINHRNPTSTTTSENKRTLDNISSNHQTNHNKKSKSSLSSSFTNRCRRSWNNMDQSIAMHLLTLSDSQTTATIHANHAMNHLAPQPQPTDEMSCIVSDTTTNNTKQVLFYKQKIHTLLKHGLLSNSTNDNQQHAISGGGVISMDYFLISLIQMLIQACTNDNDKSSVGLEKNDSVVQQMNQPLYTHPSIASAAAEREQRSNLKHSSSSLKKTPKSKNYVNNNKKKAKNNSSKTPPPPTSLFESASSLYLLQIIHKVLSLSSSARNCLRSLLSLPSSSSTSMKQKTVITKTPPPLPNNKILSCRIKGISKQQIHKARNKLSNLSSTVALLPMAAIFPINDDDNKVSPLSTNTHDNNHPTTISGGLNIFNTCGSSSTIQQQDYKVLSEELMHLFQNVLFLHNNNNNHNYYHQQEQHPHPQCLQLVIQILTIITSWDNTTLTNHANNQPQSYVNGLWDILFPSSSSSFCSRNNNQNATSKTILQPTIQNKKKNKTPSSSHQYKDLLSILEQQQKDMIHEDLSIVILNLLSNMLLLPPRYQLQNKQQQFEERLTFCIIHLIHKCTLSLQYSNNTPSSFPPNHTNDNTIKISTIAIQILTTIFQHSPHFVSNLIQQIKRYHNNTIPTTSTSSSLMATSTFFSSEKSTSSAAPPSLLSGIAILIDLFHACVFMYIYSSHKHPHHQNQQQQQLSLLLRYILSFMVIIMTHNQQLLEHQNNTNDDGDDMVIPSFLEIIRARKDEFCGACYLLIHHTTTTTTAAAADTPAAADTHPKLWLEDVAKYDAKLLMEEILYDEEEEEEEGI